MTWTSRYSEKWPRLTALFHLDNGVESDVHENGRYETTFQEPPSSEPFYKFYLHPDDIGRGRSVSQYSIQNAGREDANSSGSSVCNNANIRMFLGTVLLFSLAGIVAVAVTLAVLLSQPHGSSQKFSRIDDKAFSDRFLIQKEKFLSQELCNMMKDMFKLDANENRPVLDCSVSLLIQDGHMKVDFKIPATDKLMNEEMEKIKQNVLKNIKDLDFGLGVVSNSDDISIYKKDNQMSTTVQIILNTTKSVSSVTLAPTTGEVVTKVSSATLAPTTGEVVTKVSSVTLAPTTGEVVTKVSSVTLAPTTSEVVTKKDVALEGMEVLPTTAKLSNVTEGGSIITEAIDKGPTTSTTTAEIPPGSTSLPITTDLTTEKSRSMTETLRSTTETLRSTTETLRSTTETLISTHPLPDHTSKDDLSFLSHFNKTIKDLIQDFQGFGVTENPFTDTSSTKSYAESKHTEQDKKRPHSPEINKDYYGLSLDANDNLDLNGLQFLGKDVTTQADIQNRSVLMFEGLGVTKTSMASDFIDVATARDKYDTHSTTNPAPASPLTEYSTTETVPSLDDLFQNFNFDGLKSNELMHSKQTDNKLPVSTTPTSLTTIFLNATKHLDDVGNESSTNTSNSTQLSSLQDLYQDFLWNFGTREQTTIKTDYPVHDHSTHGSNPDEHHGLHGLSFAPAHFSKKTIAPELTLTKDSHFDFDGLESVSTKNATFETMINETSTTQNATLGKNSSESEPLYTLAVSVNDSLLGTAMPRYDGLTTESSHTHEQSGSSTESQKTVITVSKQEEPFESGVTNMYSAARSSAVTSTPTIITENTALPYPNFRSNSSQTTIQVLSGTFSIDSASLTQLSVSDLKISAILQSPLVEDNVMTSVVNIVPTQLLSSFSTEYKQPLSTMQNSLKSSRTKSAFEKNAYTDELTSKRNDLPSHFIETSYSNDPFLSSRLNNAEESVDLQSSKIGLIIDDVVFPRQLSFPEQKLVDPTLMYFPVMSVQSSRAVLSSLNLDNNHSLNDAGWEKAISNSIKSSTETGPTQSFNVIKTFSSVQIPSLKGSSHVEKSSIIPSLSISRTTSSRHIQHSEVSRSFYFPDNYDTTNDDVDLVLGSNLPYRMFSENLNKAQHSEIQPSFYTTFVSSSTYEPLSSPILASELTSHSLHKPTEMLDTSLAIQTSYIVEHVSNKPTSSTPITDITESFVQQTIDSSKVLMDLDINKTKTQGPELSSLFLPKSNRTYDNEKGKVNNTFPVFPNIMDAVTFPNQNLIGSIREAVHPTLPLSSSLDKSLVEPVQSEEIGVFGTNLQWDALDIKPTKSMLVSNGLSTVIKQKTDLEEPTLLYPSTSADTLYLRSNSKAHDQIPSVYTVTHEPIVYLTIDTRPVTHSSIFIQPTPSNSLQATLFRKLEDLSIRDNRDKFKFKSISDDFILSTMKTPTNLAITTSRPNLTPEQFSEIRRRLARLRAAKLQDLRRQRNLLNKNFKVGEDFALRREISGSNTAATLVGRGLSVNNRRLQQRPTPRPRLRVTTENPRQRIDRNRLFPGFNIDGQFNRNFLNNIRWNG